MDNNCKEHWDVHLNGIAGAADSSVLSSVLTEFLTVSKAERSPSPHTFTFLLREILPKVSSEWSSENTLVDGIRTVVQRAEPEETLRIILDCLKDSKR